MTYLNSTLPVVINHLLIM